MPNVLNNAYASVADIHEALRQTDTADDDRITLCLNAASRQIDNFCDRRFWLDPGPSPRIYIANDPFSVEVDDFQTTTGLLVKTDPNGDRTWPITIDPSDYQLEPVNAMYQGQPWPWTKIRAIRTQLLPIYGAVAYPYPRTQALIQVTAQWGWTTIPDDVKKACVVQTLRLLKSDDVPLGATPFGETGVIRLRSGMHPDAESLLDRYQSDGVFVA